MRYIKFKGLLTNSGWKNDIYLGVNTKGNIESISSSKPDTEDVEEVNGYALPGFQNGHSHAFQYAMAGLAETHEAGSNPDDFWSWREAMYSLALSISPDELESIATMLYSEMLRHGYTAVAEFHYVHHDKNGNHFNNLSEMGERLVAAAKKTGIKITLVPIFYQKGGFGKAPSERQQRFISPTIDNYLELLEASNKSCNLYNDAKVAFGIHSMRGVEPTDIAKVSELLPENTPFHIHVSEQLKEIEDSVAYIGKRPVEWLLDNLNMNKNYQLVHATHLTENEVSGIAKCGAQVVICPTTEGNLGDGIFPLRDFQSKGGNWCFGTDSHVSLNALEELRILDYGQRLISHKRNTYNSNTEGDSGQYAMNQGTINGRVSVGNYETEYFKEGQPLDAFVVDADFPLLQNTKNEFLMSSILYSTDQSAALGTMVNGEWKVQNNKHILKSEIIKDFSICIKGLGNR